MARKRAAGKDGPGRRPQLPDGYLGTLFGHYSSRCDVVRKSRPEFDGHAQLHPSALAGRPSLLGVKKRLGDFQGGCQEVFELSARHFPEPVEDVVAAPLAHDSPAEIAQPDMKQWIKGECDAIPGKTMPAFQVVQRDYKHVYDQFVSYGPLVRENGLGAHGTKYSIQDEYDQYLRSHPTETWDGATYPSLRDDIDACNVILTSPASPTANWHIGLTKTWRRRRASP